MNKLKTLFIGLAAFVSSNVMAQTITPTELVEIEPGETAEVEFTVNSETKIALAEFFLALPEGITVAYDEDEEDYVYEKNSSMLIKSHSVTVTPAADGSMYILVKNESGKEFKEASGVYLTLTLQAADTFGGRGIAKMSKILMCGLDAVQTNTIEEAEFEIVQKGGTDGINDISIDAANQKVYTVGGQRVTSKNLKKGIYVVDGKKVTVK